MLFQGSSSTQSVEDNLGLKFVGLGWQMCKLLTLGMCFEACLVYVANSLIKPSVKHCLSDVFVCLMFVL